MAIAAMFPALSALAGGATATSVGLSTAQMALTGLQIVGSVAEAASQARQAARQGQQLATQQAIQQQFQREQSRQLTEQSQSEMGRVAQQALAERSRLYTQASEAGVSGGLLDRLSNEITLNEAQAIGDIRQTTEIQQLDLYNKGVAGRNQAQARQANLASAGRRAWLGSGLKIAGALEGLEGKARVDKPKASTANIAKQ